MVQRIEFEPRLNFRQRIEPEFRVPFSLWFLEISTIRSLEEILRSSAFAKEPSPEVRYFLNLALEGSDKTEFILSNLRRAKTADIVTDHAGYDFNFSDEQNEKMHVKTGVFVLDKPSAFTEAFRHNVGNSLSTVSGFPSMVDRFSKLNSSIREAIEIRKSFPKTHHILHFLSQAEKIIAIVGEDRIGLALPPLCPNPIFTNHTDRPRSRIAA
ncbi:MAG: hypothetical protein M1268_02680 [Patescibacteria group bacterium]|nr:hypothetical protein [Patescibacteria group bacterium]